jgi:hypothetical protein
MTSPKCGAEAPEFGRTIVTQHQPVNSNTETMFNNQNITELSITFGCLALGLAIIAGMTWMERRPPNSFEPRLVPTTPIMFAGAFVSLIAMVHLVNLFGGHTGR